MKTPEQITAEVQALLKLSTDPTMQGEMVQAVIGCVANALMWVMDTNDQAPSQFIPANVPTK